MIKLGPGLTQTPLPKGFKTSGVNCGIRRYRPDLGLILSEVPSKAVGVFTLNQFKAAPVLYCQKILPSESVRAIVTVSGQANAATGEQGVLNNYKMAESVAKQAGCRPEDVITASTGVIGDQLKIYNITEAMPELFKRVGTNAQHFALAILTTDLVPKTVSTEVELSGGKIVITGICKGSGMIHPNMATMLGYIITDAELDLGFMQTTLKECADASFNMISVDGETSTNDSLFFLANGESKVSVKTDADIKKIKAAILDVCIALAKSIARDGEGASKLLEVKVKNAPDLAIARKAARGLVVSPLVRTAIYGCDPNWGRILARLGADGVPSECFEKINVKLQGITVYNKGPKEFEFVEMQKELHKDNILIDIDLNSGSHNATAWGCDLTKKYIEINAEYTS